MSRSGYTDDGDNWQLWRGTVANAIRGKRGQSLLRDLISALDALPEKRLIKGDLRNEDGVCAIGSVGAVRGIELEQIDPEDYDAIAKTFAVSAALVREIEYINDEAVFYNETPEQRWNRVRAWAEAQLRSTSPTAP